MITQPIALTLPNADSRRRTATLELDQDRRSDLGQFLTPAPVARLMAGMFADLPRHVTVLDAGAGIGGLTAAFVAEACARGAMLETLRATAFESDDILTPHLRETYAGCQRMCHEHAIRFDGQVHHADFLSAAVSHIEGSLFGPQPLTFNTAILNPPYRKIGTASRERLLVRKVGIDATNLYAAFVALAVRLLAPDGQLVAIIPRSFCNGPYFRAFRDVLLGETALLRVHVFNSRREAFRDDGVLQENVIIHVRKSTATPSNLTVSSSSGAADSAISARTIDYSDVVRSANGDRFIHLPTDVADDLVARWMARMPATLQSTGITVSTGRVVDFRARDFLLQDPRGSAAPLIYPCHISGGVVEWPRKGSRKPNALVHAEETRSLLVPRGYYVVTKRFSSKEERRRVVAAVYDPEVIPAPYVGFENHLNYFHRDGGGLGKEEAFGLCAFLNSAPLDSYFRQFNGHTQVNATDLRSLRYPTPDVLSDLGRIRVGLGSSDLETAVLQRYPLS